MHLQFPHQPIRLQSQGGILIMLFTLCMASSLWLLLELDHQQTRLLQHPTARVTMTGTPVKPQSQMMPTDSFSASVRQVSTTSTHQVSGTLVSYNAGTNQLVLMLVDNNGKQISTTITLMPHALITALQPDPSKANTSLTMANVPVGSYVAARSSTGTSPFMADLLFVSPLTHSTAATSQQLEAAGGAQ